MTCPNCSDVEMVIQDSGNTWVNFHAADDRSKYSCPACGYCEWLPRITLEHYYILRINHYSERIAAMLATLKATMTNLWILFVLTAITTIPAMSVWALGSGATDHLAIAVLIGIAFTLVFYAVMLPPAVIMTRNDLRRDAQRKAARQHQPHVT